MLTVYLYYHKINQGDGMNREIRIPKQNRSIEKKNKIIDAAYKIFNAKGYHNTTTAEIAKEAGIATGSVYAYFKDKKDIFIEALFKYNDIILEIIMKEFNQINLEEDLSNVIKTMVNVLIDCHNLSKNFHDEIMSLSFLEQDIHTKLKIQNQKIINTILTQLESKNILIQNSREKMFLILNVADSLCHELSYSSNYSLNKDIAINECVYMIKSLLLH